MLQDPLDLLSLMPLPEHSTRDFAFLGERRCYVASYTKLSRNGRQPVFGAIDKCGIVQGFTLVSHETGKRGTFKVVSINSSGDAMSAWKLEPLGPWAEDAGAGPDFHIVVMN